MAKKLKELTQTEFNTLKDSGILKSIYPDAPNNFEDIKGRRPNPVANPDFSAIQKMAIEHLNDIEKGEDREDDDHYFYEAVMSAVYGREIWDYINNLHK